MANVSVYVTGRSRESRGRGQSKTWKVLTKLRCRSLRATAIMQAILVLQAAEDVRYT
ncbi:hypothetical protein [Micromonospora sp. RTP1Z1]|uniref:hypothetical protein n=1 Tax=Micromonospora sp. RTP1Z1 TaxID=2994043 RepID=UPI0039B69098